MPETKTDIDAVLAELEAMLDEQIEKFVGDSQQLLLLNISKPLQLTTARFIHTEMDAGSNVQDVGAAVALACGDAMVQFLSTIQPQQRSEAFAELMMAMAVSIKNNLKMLEEQERKLNAGEDITLGLDIRKFQTQQA